MIHNINLLLISSKSASQKAVRQIFQSETLIPLLIETQVIEFGNLRKQYPTLDRKVAIEVSIFNSAIRLLKSKSEKFYLAKIRSAKKNPKLDWLKLRRSFVVDLRNGGASLRAISRAVKYKFHYKVSHTQIAMFLKTEV